MGNNVRTQAFAKTDIGANLIQKEARRVDKKKGKILKQKKLRIIGKKVSSHKEILFIV